MREYHLTARFPAVQGFLGAGALIGDLHSQGAGPLPVEAVAAQAA
ncbi:hypothetical protein [Streptomyces sp. NPDC050263]